MRKLFYCLIFCICLLNFFYNCKKVKKNKELRNLLKLLTDKVDVDDGKNEYSRLTQSPKIEMKLSKTKFKTALQDVLVQSYSENVKEFISQANYQISKEKSILDEINNSNYNLIKIIHILQENNNLKQRNKLLNKYFHYLEDDALGLNFFPVYKTFKSNASHFNNSINFSLLPHELLEKGYLSNEHILRNSQKLSFPERGDPILDV